LQFGAAETLPAETPIIVSASIVVAINLKHVKALQVNIISTPLKNIDISLLTWFHTLCSVDDNGLIWQDRGTGCVDRNRSRGKGAGWVSFHVLVSHAVRDRNLAGTGW
jgi:hypothetical protein